LQSVHAAAWFVVTSISIDLSFAYASIYLNLRNGWRGEGESMSPRCPWSRPLVAINAVASRGIFITVFVLPPNELVLWTMLAVACSWRSTGWSSRGTDSRAIAKLD
jgi:hypothetical protein